MRCVPVVLLLYAGATFTCCMSPAAWAATSRRAAKRPAKKQAAQPAAPDEKKTDKKTGAGIADVAVTALPGWTAIAIQKPASKEMWAILQNPVTAAVKPRASKMLCFAHGTEHATVVYLEYDGESEAARVLPQLRLRLWSGETAPPDAPHLLRAGNLVAIVEARSLQVTLAVSRGLLPAGAVQDAADLSGDGSSNGPVEVPAQGPREVPAPQGPREIPAETPGEPESALDPVDLSGPRGAVPNSEQIAAGLGRFAEAAADAGKLLQEQHYAEALAAYQAYQKDADRDPSAGDLPRWDAASGVGLAAAYSGKMQLARESFTRALQPAARLDARKLAETYFNLACAQAELGDKGAALKALGGCMEAAARAGSELHYRQAIRTDKSLRALQADPRLKRILAAK